MMTSLADYEKQRVSFIANDLSLRRENLTAGMRTLEEIKADQVVRKIRAMEAETIWKADYPLIPHPFPGMEFLTGKSIIVKTKVFKILSKMPKGALLHAHLDAMVNAKILLELGLKQPGIHVRILRPLSSDTMTGNLPQFRILPSESLSSCTSLNDDAYTHGSWVPIQDARRQFSPELGGAEGFDQWVCNSLTINPSEAYGTHNTVQKIWKKFSSTFSVASGLFGVEPIFSEYVREFLKSIIADGISYAEVRINFSPKFMYGADGQENVPHRRWVDIFGRVLEEMKEEMVNLGRENEFLGARIIYSVVRDMTGEELEWYLEDCIQLKKEFPHLIAGFDLVGPENVLKPLIYYAEQLLRFRERVNEEKLDLPFIFHAGETTGDGTKADTNIYDAILLGTKRIGHGFSLIKHPKLVETCREKGIAVEERNIGIEPRFIASPLTEFAQRLTSSMPMHPLPALLNNGVPVALCSDDPAAFGNMGLTFDFYQVLVASEITGLSTLGALARDSIEFSTMEEKEKEIALKSLERRWKEFIEYVLAEYKGEVEG